MPGLMGARASGGGQPNGDIEKRTLAAIRGVAQKMAKYGRNGDTLLAHLSEDEAALLRAMGGAGTTNPTTGAKEYYSEGDGPNGQGQDGGESGSGPGGMGGGGGPGENAGHSSTDAEGEMAGAAGPSGRSGAEAAAGGQADVSGTADNSGRGGGPTSGGDNGLGRAIAEYGGRAMGAKGFAGTGYGFGGFGTAVGAATAVGDLMGAIAAEAGVSVDEPTGVRGGDPSNFGGGNQGNDIGGATEMPAPATTDAAAQRAASYAMPSGVAQKRGLMQGAAARMAAAGRDGDTLIAHINPKEAALLKAMGGRGTINPTTGALEFAPGFDADYYLKQNPDVAAGIEKGWFTSAEEHYNKAGRSEGRNISALDTGYKTANPDVAAAVKEGTQYSGVSHYGNEGIKENRPLASTPGDFDAEAYLAANPDVAAAGVDAYSHWVASGKDENRRLRPAAIKKPPVFALGNRPAINAPAPNDSVEERLTGILSKNSPLMRRAEYFGNASANRRGLLNSSMAVEAAQNAMIDSALPIARQDADQSFQKNLSNQKYQQDRVLLGDEISSREYMQGREITSQRDLQNNELGYRRWAEALNAQTRMDIANLQVATEDRDNIGALVASAQQNYFSTYQDILNNPDIPAEARQDYLDHIANLTRDQLDIIQEMYGVVLSWSPSTPVAA